MQGTDVMARQGRSPVSRRLDAIPASGIRRFFDIIATMKDVISLGVGEPDFVTPNHIRQAAVHSIEDGETRYTSNFGMIQLREALAEKLERRYGVLYDPATEIIMTAGSSEGLDIALHALLDPGDGVLIADPYYVAYPPTVELAGGVPQFVPTHAEHGFRLRVEELERAVQPNTKLLMLGYPSNPTGAVMSREELLAVADFVERHDLYVLSDEIYDRLVYGVEHTCFAALPGMRERTVLLNGFSKAYAMTGWRLGYVAAPPVITEAMMRVHQYVMMSAPTAAQFAAIEALAAGEEDVRSMVAEYDRRRRVMVDGFNRIGLHCFEPHGAFYCFPNITATGLDEIAFAERLLHEEKVAVVPGSAFGARGAGHVRACYATALEEIEEALVRIERFVTRLRASD
jgi:aminotransferase